MTDPTNLPKFSIVLPSHNTADHLRETIESILDQDYPDIEFIITDGGSTDGTLDILRGFGDRIKWVSSPDDGQSDAINKGFAMSTGALHYWANADDPLEPNALRHVAGLLTDLSAPQWMVGAARLIDGKGNEFGRRIVSKVDENSFLLWAVRWIPTQSVFWNRKMWEVAGPFDKDLHYVMDLGLWQRMYQTAPAIITPKVLASYRLHADSKSISGIEKSRDERKLHLARIIARDMQTAQASGEEALVELADRYSNLIDELADQAALVERLKQHRLAGPLMRYYQRKTAWFPKFDV